MARPHPLLLRLLPALGLAAAVLTAPLRAGAQGFEAEVRLDQLNPASAGSRFLRAEGPRTPFDSGIGYAFSLTGDYGYQPLTSQVTGDSDANPLRRLVEHAFLLHAGASLTPVDWLSIDLSVPFALVESGENEDRVPQQGLSAGSAGIGDIRAGALAWPVMDRGFSLGMGARVWLPTGSTAAYLSGDDKFSRFEAVLALAGQVDVLSYGCTLGIAPLFFAGRDGDRISGSCAGQLRLTSILSAGIEPHVAAFAFSHAADESQHAPGLGTAALAIGFEPLATIGLQLGPIALRMAGGPGIGGAPGTPAARMTLTISHGAHGQRPMANQEPNDRDLDGIADALDSCPDQAGPKKNGGCPRARDLDGDGLITDDACPAQPGAKHQDPKANGCPDRDNDGWPDPIDSCPQQPGGPEGCPRYARLRGGAFVITPPLAFRPGKTALEGSNRQAFIEVTRSMRVNPAAKRIRIVLGTKGASAKQSSQRIEAIKALLLDQTVASTQFELIGKDSLAGGKVQISIVRD